MKSTSPSPDYPTFLTELKGRIQAARIAAGRAVSRELVMLYCDIGRGIVEKQKVAGWGDAVVERLAADLRAEFPDMRGFSAVKEKKTHNFALALPEHFLLKKEEVISRYAGLFGLKWVFFPIPALLVGCESRFAPSSRLGLGKNPSFIICHLLGGLH